MFTTDLVPFFLLLNRYYARMLTRVAPEEWPALEAYCDYLKNRCIEGSDGTEAARSRTSCAAGAENAACPACAADAKPPACESEHLTDEAVRDIECAIRRIAAATPDEAIELEYEFNRLFLGPDKPQAAPYETVYMTEERVLMRERTLSVRAAYSSQGFEVNAKNTEPDDHAAYECAFAAALLEQRSDTARAAFDAFMEEHLGCWARAHTEQIRAHTENAICLGFADLFDAVTAAACA